MAAIDWYERRDELDAGDVFTLQGGGIVKLDYRVPGDGTQWYVADWSGGSWAYWDSKIEPGDLADRCADPCKANP